MSQTRNSAPKVATRDLFATPITVCEWPDADRLNAELRDTILRHQSVSPGVVNSNRKGWHSKTDFHRWPEPCVAAFVELVHEATAKMAAHLTGGADTRYTQNWRITGCWANVNPRGGFNKPHNHIGGGQLSGFYYVDLGDCADPTYAGRTVFEDRSGVAEAMKPGRPIAAREYAMVPKPGVLVLFPAAQYHYVEPYRGNSQRITIAFNLAHPDFDVLYYPGMEGQSWWWTNFRGLMLLKTKIPEQLRALSLLPSYAAQDLRRSGDRASFFRKLKVAYDRASVDAAAAADDARTAKAFESPPSEKRPIV
jgi:uncharacterized protein (TIGR02466 family)